ncbi:hypothetical protein P4475_11760 [Halalkalibacterium halodurans]|nr:hypothetical protein [Halalkalibacterium halodurans]
MNMQMLCQQHLHQMVQVNTHPYGTYKGFLEQVDHENVSLLVPIDDNGDYMEMDNESLFYSMNGQVPQQMMGARGEERFYPYYPYPYF